MNWFMKVFAGLQSPSSMTQDEFMGYHQTGYISPDAYGEGGGYDLSHYNDEKEYGHTDHRNPHQGHGQQPTNPFLITTKNIDGMDINFWGTGQENKYVHWLDEEHSKHRYLTEEETAEQDIPSKDQTIYLYHDDNCIGHVGDSWGATELFVVKEYQGHGIGTEALKLYMEMNPSRNHETPRLGQMTSSGTATATNVWMKFVEDAIARGEQLKPEVLKSYEDTKKMKESGFWSVKRR